MCMSVFYAAAAIAGKTNSSFKYSDLAIHLSRGSCACVTEEGLRVWYGQQVLGVEWRNSRRRTFICAFVARKSLQIFAPDRAIVVKSESEKSCQKRLQTSTCLATSYAPIKRGRTRTDDRVSGSERDGSGSVWTSTVRQGKSSLAARREEVKEMAHRGTLSPRWQGATSSSSVRSRGADVPDEEKEILADPERSGPVHAIRARAPSSYGYIFLATLEGVLSASSFRSACAVSVPIISTFPLNNPAEEALISASASAFAVAGAVRSGAALALGTPFFLLAARCAIFALNRVRIPAVQRLQLQQPRLGFPLPAGVDEKVAVDLYVIGLAAAVLGGCVPALEMAGIFLGDSLKGRPPVWVVLAFLVLIPVIYLALGAWLDLSSPGEGFIARTRPTTAMCGLCAAGHVILLAGCFYSPDVSRTLGFLLGLVHIVRTLLPAFAYPAGSGAAACEEDDMGASAHL
ncbi:unnamed protein product [Ectocarpus sp. 13 AM-2016]